MAQQLLLCNRTRNMKARFTEQATQLKPIARLVTDNEDVTIAGAGMQSEQVQTLFPTPGVAERLEVDRHGAVPRGPIAQRLLAMMRACQRLMFAGSGHAVAPHDAGGLACAEDSTHAITGERSIMQINNSDREFLNAFPSQRKSQVMKTIMSLTPTRKVVCQGHNQFEKAVLNFHRDGYGLIDMQPQENAFTTVWYRKKVSFLGKGADVTMLLWEDGELGDAVTLMHWRI